MELAIFAKRVVKNDGKIFYRYISQLSRKSTGEAVSVTVKFRDNKEPNPELCPMNIIVDKCNANLSERHYSSEDGTEGVGHTLWVSAWEQGAPYVDHSLDDFE